MLDDKPGKRFEEKGMLTWMDNRNGRRIPAFRFGQKKITTLLSFYTETTHKGRINTRFYIHDKFDYLEFVFVFLPHI
jgi:hypothetical protein